MKPGLGRAEPARNYRRSVASSGPQTLLLARAIGAVIWATLYEHRRSTVPLVYVTIGIVAAVVASLPRAIGSEQRAELMLEIVFVAVPLLAGSAVIFFTSAIAPRDIEERWAIPVLSKPIPRWLFVVGRGAGLSLSTAIFASLSFVVCLVSILIIAPDSFKGSIIEKPTKLIPGDGPEPQGRLVYLSGFPTELRWLTSDTRENDSVCRFTFAGKDVLACAEKNGYVRLEMSGLNCNTSPMSGITPALASVVTKKSGTTATQEITFKNREARLELTEDTLTTLTSDETLTIELRPVGVNVFLVGDRGKAYLALPGAYSFSRNFLMASFGLVFGLVVVCMATFVGSTLFSAKVAILIGGFFSAMGVTRENIEAMMRLMGGSVKSWNVEGAFDPQKVLTDYNTEVAEATILQDIARQALEALSFLFPDLTRFSFSESVISGFCVTGVDLLQSASYLGSWVGVFLVISIITVHFRRMQ